MESELDLDETIAELTLPEKVMILSGANACSTVPIPRLKIPKLQVRQCCQYESYTYL